MDTNPFAVNPNTVQQPQQTPSYLKQDPAASGHWVGGVSNMVKALMDGYANRPKQAANADRPVGPPLSLAPPAPVNPASMSPPPVSNVGGVPRPASPFDVGATPIQPSPIPYDPTVTRNPMPQVGGLPGMPSAVGNVDPSMRGLFSQIPGEYGG